MNQARRLEILEILVSNHNEFEFADFEMVDNPDGVWTAEERIECKIIAEHEDVVKCYDMAINWLAKRNQPKQYLQVLENLALKLAGAGRLTTTAEFKSLRAEAKRILKLKEPKCDSCS